MQFQNFPVQRPLPNTKAVLVLGIISIVGCFCYGIPGTIFSVSAFALFCKDRKLYLANGGMYTKSSFKNEKLGFNCAIIGFFLSIICIIFIIVIVAFIGVAALSNPAALKHALGQ